MATSPADLLRPGAVPAALTIAEVAALTRTGKTLIWGEIRAGRLRVTRLGSRVTRVRVEDYLAWLQGGAEPCEAVAASPAPRQRRGR